MRIVHEAFLDEHVDAVGSSENWDAWKPAPEFFEHVAAMMRAAPSEIVYVGDRVDNDVVPALAFGMGAIRIRRGAHAGVESPSGTSVIDSLAELPDVLL
jgi:FMN phosphatase YigB (HAD superfamily)